MQHDGGVGHSQAVVLDVHLMGGGELGVVEDLVLTPRHIPDTVLHLRDETK